MMRAILGVLVVVSLTGCATVTGSKNQPLTVQAFQENKEVEGATCTLTNDEGKWTVTTPGNVIVHKSTDDLQVYCNKEKVGNGSQRVESKANGAVWGNIILGGGIGYIADRETGAGFNYPPIITVILDKIAETVGMNDAAKAETAPATATPAVSNDTAMTAAAAPVASKEVATAATSTH